MSGLFLRLAAQASGQRSTALHSSAALPYQGVPEQLEPLASAAERPPVSMVQATAPPQPAVIPGPETAPPLSASLRRRLADSEAMTAQATDKQMPAVIPRVFQAHDEPAAAPFNRERTDTEAPSASAVPPGLLTRPMTTATTSFSAQQEAASFSHNQKQTTDGHVPRPLLTPARHESVAIEPAFGDDSSPLPLPPPLLSPRPAEARQKTGAAVPLAAPPPSTQPDEVHIHIGRIEVTAIQDRASSKRASRKGAAPLSLDDYLAKRKGDGR